MLISARLGMWWWQRLEVGCPPETRSPWGDIRDAWNVIDSNRYLFTIRASRILMKFRQSKLTRLYTNCQILDSCQTGKYMIRFFKPFNQNSLFLPRDCGEDLGNQKWFNGWLTCPPWLFLKYYLSPMLGDKKWTDLFPNLIFIAQPIANL